MSSKTAPGAPAISRTRRWIFRLMMLFGIYVIVESFSFLAFWMIDGEPFSFRRLQEQRRPDLHQPGDGTAEMGLIRDAQTLFEVSSSAEAAGDGPRHVRLTGDGVLQMIPQPLDREDRTSFIFPVEAGRHRVSAHVQYLPQGRFPIVLVVELLGPAGDVTQLLEHELDPGEMFLLNEAFELAEAAEVAIRCAMAEGAEDRTGARLLLNELEDLAIGQGEAPAASDAEPRPKRKTFAIDRVIHPYQGYVIERGSVARRGPRDFTANEYGFYDDSPPLHEKSPDKLILGILGGSVAEKFSQLGMETLAQELARSPRFAGREVVVVRAALRGYKQPQQLMTLGYLLSLGAEFDLVINIDGFNEVAFHLVENAKQGVAAAFPRNWYMHFVDRTDPEVRRITGEISYLEGERASWDRRFSASPWRFSITSNLVWKIGDRRRAKKIAERNLFLQSYEPATAAPHEVTGPRKRYQDTAAMAEDLAAIWQRSSLQLHRLSQANGIRYFHFLQPNQYVPDSKPLSAWEQENAYNEQHPYKQGFGLGYPFLVEKSAGLTGAGVEFHDLSPIFADTADTVYIDPCCHFNQLGNDIMARAIARAILAGS